MIKINPIFNRIMVVNLISEYENHWAVSVMYKNIFNSNALSLGENINYNLHGIFLCRTCHKSICIHSYFIFFMMNILQNTATNLFQGYGFFILVDSGAYESICVGGWYILRAQKKCVRPPPPWATLCHPLKTPFLKKILIPSLTM